MTTLTNKFQDITKQLQQLTIWRPNERNPFLELDRWREDAHQIIDQWYNKKRYEIEQISEKHEREFLRQLARQRLQLSNIQKKLATKSPTNTHLRAFNDNSIFNELQAIENDIKTRLGRAEVVIEATPLNCEGLVTIGLKTYLSGTPMAYSREISFKDSSKKPTRRPLSEVQRAYKKWVETKNKEEAMLKEMLTARQEELNNSDEKSRRHQQNEEAYEHWTTRKKESGAFKKKKIIRDDNDDNDDYMGQDIHET